MLKEEVLNSLYEQKEAAKKLCADIDKKIDEHFQSLRTASLLEGDLYYVIADLLTYYSGTEWHFKMVCSANDIFTQYYESANDKIFVNAIDVDEYSVITQPIQSYFYDISFNKDEGKSCLRKANRFPAYVQDFIDYIMKYRIENNILFIPKEDLKILYNNFISNYDLEARTIKDSTLTRKNKKQAD